MSAPSSAPDFVIAGAPKCGTTSLHHWLGEHPDVHMIRGEPHFFAHDLAYNQPPMPARRYAALCRQAGSKKRCGDRSTWYLYSKEAAAAIQAANPDARILILVRQPAELLHSIHAHYCQRGAREPLTDLEQAIAAESDRREGKHLPPNGGFMEKFFYSDLPDYAQGIQRFRAAFRSDQIKVIVFDDLRDRPAQTYAEVLAFLGLETVFEPDFDIYNQSAPAPFTLWRRLWRRGHWRHTVRQWTPEWWQSRQLERKRRQREKAAAIAPWPPLDDRLYARLTGRFEPEIIALEDLISRRLPQWRCPSQGGRQTPSQSATEQISRPCPEAVRSRPDSAKSRGSL